MTKRLDPTLQKVLQRGAVIPAHPLALTANRRLDERRQRALTRYYVDSGAGGIAVGVHTTQFAIRDPRVGLLEPVLHLVAEEMDRAQRSKEEPLVRIGGICGATAQAAKEAQLLVDLRYSVGLVSLAALKDAEEEVLLTHCKEIAQILPVFGFYLQPAVGGRILSYKFWRAFVELDNVVGVKIAPFNRYQTLDVVRAVAESGQDVSLYTGNDDNIVMDLITPYVFTVDGKPIERRIIGGLLGHWAVWTRQAVNLLRDCHSVASGGGNTQTLMRQAVEVTDCNAAFFDASNKFAGCIAGIHEVLRRQGLLEGIWCLDPQESLGQGQFEEIERVYTAYPHLNDDDFVREHLDRWLTP
jgi:hypothetical protein